MSRGGTALGPEPAGFKAISHRPGGAYSELFPRSCYVGTSGPSLRDTGRPVPWPEGLAPNNEVSGNITLRPTL